MSASEVWRRRLEIEEKHAEIEILKKHAINLRLDADDCALENERLKALLETGREIVEQYAPGFELWIEEVDAALGKEDKK